MLPSGNIGFLPKLQNIACNGGLIWKIETDERLDIRQLGTIVYVVEKPISWSKSNRQLLNYSELNDFDPRGRSGGGGGAMCAIAPSSAISKILQNPKWMDKLSCKPSLLFTRKHKSRKFYFHGLVNIANSHSNALYNDNFCSWWEIIVLWNCLLYSEGNYIWFFTHLPMDPFERFTQSLKLECYFFIGWRTSNWHRMSKVQLFVPIVDLKCIWNGDEITVSNLVLNSVFRMIVMNLWTVSRVLKFSRESRSLDHCNASTKMTEDRNKHYTQ